MAKAIEVAFFGAALGALLLTGTARAEGSSSGHPPSGAPPAAELAAGACRLGRWAAAVDLLRDVAPDARNAEAWLCLARAQVGLGMWVDALDSYDEMAERASTDPSARNALQVGALERQGLEARLAWLQLVPSDPLSGDAQLTLDGEPISRSRLGVEFPVQPGERRIAVEGHGMTRDLANLVLREGEHRRLALAIPLGPRIGRARAELLAAPAAASTRAEESAYARWSRRALYGGGIGTITGLTLLGTSGRAHSDASTFQAVGLGSLLFGGLSFMSAALLRLGDSAPDDDAPTQPRRIEPWVTATGAGISGSF